VEGGGSDGWVGDRLAEGRGEGRGIERKRE